MGLINVDAGQRSHSESFFGTHANVYGDELPNPQLTVLPDSSAHNLNLPTPPFGLDSSVSVQKKADDELAKFMADVHADSGLWRPLSADTSVGKWLGRFNQSWGTPAMRAWMKAQHFVPRSLRLHGSTLTAQSIVDGKVTHRTFTPSDGSGWWPLGRQAIASAAVLDPQQSGLVGGSRAVLWPENVMAFYGATWPLNNAQAGQLRISGFPAVGVTDDPLRSPDVRELASREFMGTEQEAALIKQLLGVIKDKPGDEQIDLGMIVQAITPGSSFAFANKSKPQLLKNLRDHPYLLPILRTCEADWNAQVRLVDGQLFIKSRGRLGQWNNVTAHVRAKADLVPLLDNAIEQAKTTGNIINSGAKADAQQLLRFAGMDELPAKVSALELHNVLNWKLNPLPPGSELGSYARDFLTDPQSPASLSDGQRIRVRRTAPDASIPPKLTVLDCSPKPWAGKRSEYIRENADELITQALTQGAGLRRCEPILTALKDDPSDATGEASPSYRKQMIMTRDLLVIDPTLGAQRNHIAGYNLYSASNTGKTLFEVRTELEQHLVKEKKLPLEQAILVTHAFLATAAPEFLVKGADKVRVGTLPLVSLRVQTALVEMASQGSSRLMSAEQLGSRALLTPLSTEHEQLQAMENAGPIYDWALAQGVVTDRDDYSPAALKAALTAYSDRLEDSSIMATNIDTAKPLLKTRFEAGEKELERVAPGFSTFLNKPTVIVETSSLLSSGVIDLFADTLSQWLGGAGGTALAQAAGPASLKDLYLSGALTTENINTKAWKFVDPLDKQLFETLKTKLMGLKPIHDVFHHPFSRGMVNFASANFIATKMLISEMPVEDRRRLAFGEVTVYGASTQDGDLTQEQAQEKIGPILFLKDAAGANVYELLLRTQEYVERPDLIDAMKHMSDSGTNAFGYIMRQRSNPTLPVDIDVKGHFPAVKNRALSGDLPNTYSSKRTTDLLKVLREEDVLVNQQFMLNQALGVTYNEAIQQRLDAIDSFIINTLIPFKGNIEEISSGDRRRVAMGAIGLGVETVGALFVVSGAVSGVAKGASIASKLSTIGKTVLSMLNLPGAVVGTTKSIIRLSAMGVRSVGVGTPKIVAKGLATLKNVMGGSRKGTQGLIRTSPTLSALKEGKTLLENTSLLNTINGTVDFFQQSPPTVSVASVVPLTT